jgi:beta-glucosidase
LPRPAQIDPETTTSNPATPRKGGIIALDYDIDGSDVGYRWFAREGHEPLFPFGFGLSYTTFALSGLHVNVDGRYTACVDVANTGARTGAVVVQIYVAKPGPDGYVKRLAGFTKTTLAAGERANVEIDLEPRIVARYHVGGDAPGFAIEPGDYRVWAAQHAGDDALWQDVEIDEARRIAP